FVLEVADLVVGPKHCSQSEFSGQDVAVFFFFFFFFFLDMWGPHSANHEFRGQDLSIFRSVSLLMHIEPSALFRKAKRKGKGNLLIVF
ncbi:hypothetical protein NOF04DRAFT_1337333, partial [Fusarium oxysporum II5]